MGPSPLPSSRSGSRRRFGGFPVHICGRVGVGVHCETGFGVAQDSGQCFGVHSIRQRVGGKGVPEIMKTKVGQIVFCQDRFQLSVCSAGGHGRFEFGWIGKDPYRISNVIKLSAFR